MHESQEEKERLNESEANYFQALDFQRVVLNTLL